MLARTYPMKTSRLNPDEPKKPTTLFDHFRANPRGATSYPEWLNDRVWELLQRPAVRECRLLSGALYAADHGPLFQMLRQCRSYDIGLQRRAVLKGGTIIKEWLPETKESHNVKKT